MKKTTGPPEDGDRSVHEAAADWSLTTFEGARREQIRRWAALPLEDVLDALEEMQRLAEDPGGPDSPAGRAVADEPGPGSPRR